MTVSLYPLLLQPTLHVKVWGGRKLGDVMNKPLPTGEPYGESWEVHDTSVVVNGQFAGRSLGDLLDAFGESLIGTKSPVSKGLPLLAKLIDASQWLSVQVHPDDNQADQLEGQPRGKTEAWYVLQADSDAQLVIGVNQSATVDRVASAIREGTLEDLLVYAAVSAADVLYIAAGTIHAIGPGVMVYEIQQSSDTTYRMYDWGRMGLDGNPRELHIEKSMVVANMDALPEIINVKDHDERDLALVQGEFFTTMRHRINGTMALDTNKQDFHMLTCIDGEVAILFDGASVRMLKGQSAFIPTIVGPYQLQGKGVILRSWQG